jgi:hypothetical protein
MRERQRQRERESETETETATETENERVGPPEATSQSLRFNESIGPQSVIADNLTSWLRGEALLAGKEEAAQSCGVLTAPHGWGGIGRSGADAKH